MQKWLEGGGDAAKAAGGNSFRLGTIWSSGLLNCIAAIILGFRNYGSKGNHKPSNSLAEFGPFTIFCELGDHAFTRGSYWVLVN